MSCPPAPATANRPPLTLSPSSPQAKKHIKRTEDNPGGIITIEVRRGRERLRERERARAAARPPGPTTHSQPSPRRKKKKKKLISIPSPLSLSLRLCVDPHPLLQRPPARPRHQAARPRGVALPGGRVQGAGDEGRAGERERRASASPARDPARAPPPARPLRHARGRGGEGDGRGPWHAPRPPQPAAGDSGLQGGGRAAGVQQWGRGARGGRAPFGRPPALRAGLGGIRGAGGAEVMGARGEEGCVFGSV